MKAGKEAAAKVADTAPVMIRYVARLPNGTLAVKTKEWRRAATMEAIRDWVADYVERLEDGYKPAGYEVAPVPFYARVMKGKEVLAEWRRN